ncbi:serine-rich adhesin for platelets isoform X3 [Drosophila ananassae]|uniref:serine-rich adhesin for platelets isoform X3 n=1 Tax=Drosophila ananassae TaxID=7217 RepID=UPI0013A5CDE5|nr:serine-rich adhesin for platelets isoform X3 [Drosophila ananassae]
MHFVTQQRAQSQHQHQPQKSNPSSSSSLASTSSISSCSGSGSGSGSGAGSSRFVALRKSASQGALPKSLATAQSLFLRPSAQSKHKRTASLNAAPMIKDIDITDPTTSSVILTAATPDSPSGSKTPANANMIPETTQPDQLQSQSQLQSQPQSLSQTQTQSQLQDNPLLDTPQNPQQQTQPEEKEEKQADAKSDESSAGDRRDSITEEITITTTTTTSTLSTKLLTIQEAAGTLEQSSLSKSSSSKQIASTTAGGSPPSSARLSPKQRHDSSGSSPSLGQTATSTSPCATSSPLNASSQGATPSINIVSSDSNRDQQPLQSQSVDSNGFSGAPSGGGCLTDSPSSRKSSTSSKGKASQPKLSTSSSGRDEQDISQHRLSDLTPHELSLLRVDREQQVTSSSSTSNEKPAKPSRLSERAKKKSWYNVIYPNYKSRAEDFKKLFKDVPNDERLIVDYSCALQRDILVQGRLYVSQNYVCFHANIFSWETFLSIKWKDVTAITKEKTALVIPNAISIASGKDKYFFATFTSRDKSFLMLFRVWQNTLMNKQFSPQEIWKYVHSSYGEELGLTTDDEDYIDPTLDNGNETDFDFQTAIDDDSQSQRQSQQSNQSTQSNPQLPHSGNSSASSGGGASRASAPRKSKTKYFFNSSKSSANASASGSDNNKTRESSRKLNKKMKQNAKELTLSSVKPAEQSVSVTMTQVPPASSSSTAGSATNTSTSSTIANHSGSGTLTGSGSGSAPAAPAGGSDKKSAEKKISTVSSSGAAATAGTASVSHVAGTSGCPATESKLETKRKLSKNHKNAEEAVPTDVSDSSDSEANNVPFVPTTECTSTHEGRQIVHTILPINVDTLFNMLFSKSKFLTDFHASRKSTDLIMGEWSRNEEGLNVRTVNVTVQLAASVGPKSSKVTEYQTMRECSKPGELYSIDVNSVNAGIPYADSFSVLIHFCLARTVDDHTMLSVHTQIKYKKSIWGVVKGFIEKNTWAGLEDFFGSQLHALQSETCIPPAKGKGRRPRRGMNIPPSGTSTASDTATATTTTTTAVATTTSTDNDSIHEASHHLSPVTGNLLLQSHQQHQHQHLHMHHHHHHHHGSQQHHHHHHQHGHQDPSRPSQHHQQLSNHHHHHHQHPHWHHRTATQIRPLEEAGGTAQPGIAGLPGDTLDTQPLVPGAAVGAAPGHPLLLEGGKLHQQSHLHHQQQPHQHHHLQQHHHHHKQQQQLHPGGDDDGQPLAMGQGQGHRLGFRNRGLSLLVILLLCLMLALNVILLLKLWKLEERIDVDLSRRARLPSLAALKELPNTNQEWLELLRDQEIAHEAELDKWQQVLQTAIELLKKVSNVCEKIYNDGKLRQRIESMSMPMPAPAHSEF